MPKRALAYFKKHPAFTATVHFIGGVGIGILLTYPLFGSHPVTWGAFFIVIAILGHYYAANTKP